MKIGKPTRRSIKKYDREQNRKFSRKKIPTYAVVAATGLGLGLGGIILYNLYGKYGGEEESGGNSPVSELETEPETEPETGPETGPEPELNANRKVVKEAGDREEPDNVNRRSKSSSSIPVNHTVSSSEDLAKDLTKVKKDALFIGNIIRRVSDGTRGTVKSFKNMTGINTRTSKKQNDDVEKNIEKIIKDYPCIGNLSEYKKLERNGPGLLGMFNSLSKSEILSNFIEKEKQTIEVINRSIFTVNDSDEFIKNYCLHIDNEQVPFKYELISDGEEHKDKKVKIGRSNGHKNSFLVESTLSKDKAIGEIYTIKKLCEKIKDFKFSMYKMIYSGNDVKIEIFFYPVGQNLVRLSNTEEVIKLFLDGSEHERFMNVKKIYDKIIHYSEDGKLCGLADLQKNLIEPNEDSAFFRRKVNEVEKIYINEKSTYGRFYQHYVGAIHDIAASLETKIRKKNGKIKKVFNNFHESRPEYILTDGSDIFFIDYGATGNGDVYLGNIRDYIKDHHTIPNQLQSEKIFIGEEEGKTYYSIDGEKHSVTIKPAIDGIPSQRTSQNKIPDTDEGHDIL